MVREYLLHPLALGAAGWIAYLSQFPLGIESATPALVAVCLWLTAVARSVIQIIKRKALPGALVTIAISLPPLAVISRLLYFLLVQGGPDGTG